MSKSMLVYINNKSKSLFVILLEYTHNTERANNTDVYAASFTSNKVQRNHQIKGKGGQET